MHPRVGVGVIIESNGKLLLGKRLSKHGEGTWCFPGGHLEFNESIFACAERESFEEAGIEIKNLELNSISNDFFTESNKHYVTVFVKANYFSGSLTSEENKMIEWKWFSLNEIPVPLFLSTEKGLKNYLNKEFYSDK